MDLLPVDNLIISGRSEEGVEMFEDIPNWAWAIIIMQGVTIIRSRKDQILDRHPVLPVRSRNRLASAFDANPGC